MKTLSLEETIRGLLSEQYKPMDQWKKELKPTIDIGGHAHDPSGPNKSHIEEEELSEIPVNVPIGKNRRNAKKSSFAFNSLGGKKLTSRASAQRQGNQNKNRYENFDHLAEEATKKVMKKLAEKDSKKVLGKTDTGKPADIIDTEPTKSELTGPTR